MMAATQRQRSSYHRRGPDIGADEIVPTVRLNLLATNRADDADGADGSSHAQCVVRGASSPHSQAKKTDEKTGTVAKRGICLRLTER
jgi:hypothetical protein